MFVKNIKIMKPKNYLFIMLLLASCSTSPSESDKKREELRIQTLELEKKTNEVLMKKLEEKERELNKKKSEDIKLANQQKAEELQQKKEAEQMEKEEEAYMDDLIKSEAKLIKMAKKEVPNVEYALIDKLKKTRCNWGCKCEDLTFSLNQKNEPNVTSNGEEIKAEFEYYITSFCSTNNIEKNYNAKSTRFWVNTNNGYILKSTKTDDLLIVR